MSPAPTIEDFTAIATDTIRFGDTDRLGHVNNAVFSTFLETGRVQLLYDAARPLRDEGCEYVIARLALDYRAEINWPGTIQIGTRMLSVGRSSMTLAQALFQDDRCVATAETVLVQMNPATRRSQPFSERALEALRQLP